MKIQVRVTPNAKRDEVLGWKDGVLRLKVKAPPVDGKANAAVVDLLAETLGIRPADITITAGAASRLKTFEIDAPADALSRLPGIQPPIPLF